MSVSLRIRTICSELEECDSFADVGCDHGYCTRYMLENGLCRRALIADISEKSLQKAQNLLRGYIERGILSYLRADGLDGVDENTSLVLVAGIGGEEIVGIFRRAFIPRKFVLQPMKNAPLVRRYLVANGCRILRDYTFSDGAFYDVIKGEREGGDVYTEREYAFGRDNLKERSADFLRYVRSLAEKKESYLRRAMNEENRKAVRKELDVLKELL